MAKKTRSAAASETSELDDAQLEAVRAAGSAQPGLTSADGGDSDVDLVAHSLASKRVVHPGRL